MVCGLESRLDVELALSRLVDDLDLLLRAAAQIELTYELIYVESLHRDLLCVLRLCQALLVLKIRILGLLP